MQNKLLRIALIAIALFAVISNTVDARGTYGRGAVSVRGYTTIRGTYVAPHFRSAPNRTVLDNYSTRGNINPYTGVTGTKNPYPNEGFSSAQSRSNRKWRIGRFWHRAPKPSPLTSSKIADPPTVKNTNAPLQAGISN